MGHRGKSGSDGFAKKLAGYSLAAGAFLAVAPDGEAGLVTSGPLSEQFGGSSGQYYLTMEGSNPEVVFYGLSSTLGFSNVLYAFGSDDNFELFASSTFLAPIVKSVQTSQLVGSSLTFYSGGLFRLNSSKYGSVGYWNDSTPRFFGFRFDTESDGTTVYGFAKVRALGGGEGELLGWAYEDSGGPAHVVPEPTSLALFALGAAGIALYRRKRRKNAS